MRTDIKFKVEDGTKLSAWLYKPEPSSGSAPLVIMSFGFSGLKAQRLDFFAQAFVDVGLACLVYDHRNFGESGGHIRQEIDPWQQLRDMRDAISFVRTLDGIDPEKIGVWGTSYAGGHAIAISAMDRRIRCAVAQVPFISGFASGSRLISRYHMPRYLEALYRDREARREGKPPQYVPVAVNPEDQVKGEPFRLGLVDTRLESFKWLAGTVESTGYQNSVTLQSYDMLLNYEPGTYIERVSPTPLLMIVGSHDEICLTDVQLSAFNRALEPKALKLLKSGHYEIYDTERQAAAEAASAWFTKHLVSVSA